MSVDQLKQLMTEIADEVKPAPLHEQAIAQARRARIRNGWVAGVATVAVLAGTVATMAGLLSGGSKPTGPAAPEQDSATRLNGQFFAARFTPQSPAPGELLTWRTGDREATAIASSTDPLFGSVDNVSPDGRYADRLGEDGRIHVRDLGSGKDRTLPDRLDLDRACAEPVWAPDSRRLLVKINDERAYFWDVETGAVTDVAAPRGCDVHVTTGRTGEDVLFSIDDSDGAIEVYRTGTDGRTVRTPIGEAVRAAGEHLTELTAVSPDGRLACLGVNDAPDYAETLDRSNRCTMIVEIETGEALDVGGQWHATSAVFDEPGRLIVIMECGTKVCPSPSDGARSSATLALRAYDGRILDETPVPAGEDHSELSPLRYVPD